MSSATETLERDGETMQHIAKRNTSIRRCDIIGDEASAFFAPTRTGRSGKGGQPADEDCLEPLEPVTSDPSYSLDVHYPHEKQMGRQKLRAVDNGVSTIP